MRYCEECDLKVDDCAEKCPSCGGELEPFCEEGGMTQQEVDDIVAMQLLGLF